MYALIRFSKKTGKIDKTLTAEYPAMLKLWALQNAPKTKACEVLDIENKSVLMEVIGTDDGFPKVNKEENFEFNVPDELYNEF